MQQIEIEMIDESASHVPLLQGDCASLAAAKTGLSLACDALAAAQQDGDHERTQKAKRTVENARHRVLELRLIALRERKIIIAEHLEMICIDETQIQKALKSLSQLEAPC